MPEHEKPSPLPLGDAARHRLRRVFVEGFRADDVAEPVEALPGGPPAQVDPEELVAAEASLQEVIRVVGTRGRCFVGTAGRVTGVITTADLEKPPVRMFLFGMITLFEMLLVRHLEAEFPGERWREAVSPGRLEKAQQLQAERGRRGAHPSLLECLQLADKIQLAHKGGLGARFQPPMSGKAVREASQELQQLRNNLAHSQPIVAEGLGRILLFSTRLDVLLDSVAGERFGGAG
jgi:hypothetical protein